MFSLFPGGPVLVETEAHVFAMGAFDEQKMVTYNTQFTPKLKHVSKFKNFKNSQRNTYLLMRQIMQTIFQQINQL